jgi:hypothetical protein
MGAAAAESTHFCTNVPLDSVAYCLPVGAAAARRPRGGGAGRRGPRRDDC